MNTIFNSALKQSTSIRKDLSALTALTSQPPPDSSSSPSPAGVPSPAALGALSASLTAFQRTIDEYNSLAGQELNPAKQDKARERVRSFRAELAAYRRELEGAKGARDEALHRRDRGELLGNRRPYAGGDATENPYANGGGGRAQPPSAFGTGHARNRSGGGGGGGGFGMGGENVGREEHALREQNFFAGANSALDEYIARGQAVLGDLGTQREMLKNSQKRLYSVGNTLGISGDTIRMIERRTREDKWIFWAGVVIFFLFCWLVLHFLT